MEDSSESEESLPRRPSEEAIENLNLRSISQVPSQHFTEVPRHDLTASPPKPAPVHQVHQPAHHSPEPVQPNIDLNAVWDRIQEDEGKSFILAPEALAPIDQSALSEWQRSRPAEAASVYETQEFNQGSRPLARAKRTPDAHITPHDDYPVGRPSARARFNGEVAPSIVPSLTPSNYINQEEVPIVPPRASKPQPNPNHQPTTNHQTPSSSGDSGGRPAGRRSNRYEQRPPECEPIVPAVSNKPKVQINSVPQQIKPKSTNQPTQLLSKDTLKRFMKKNVANV